MVIRYKNINTRQKLEIIQKRLGLTQTKLADKFGVSFVAFNSWWTGKSEPRPKMSAAIEELFLEVTGQKVVSKDRLRAKKQSLTQKSKEHKNILAEILGNPDIRNQLILKLTYHSNSIEGSTLNEAETAAVIFDNTALPDKSLTEQLEAKNHQTALNYLFKYLAKKGKIDELMVLKLHDILMNGVRPDAGQYRQHAVRIVGVNLPTANFLSISRLITGVIGEIINKPKDPVAIATSVHSKFEKIHPFSDGNGRVGRLLMSAMLLKANLPPAIIRQQRKQLYYTYLYKAQTTSDQSQLEDFICDAILDGFDVVDRIN